VFIDSQQYALRAEKVTTTADLRRLPRPPLSNDQQLWLDVVDAPDRLLADGVAIPVTPGMRVFTQPRTIAIHIDRADYRVAAGPTTDQQLRSLPNPPIGADRDLWLDVVDAQDVKIATGAVVELTAGMRFFTAPSSVNPGMSGQPR
jgi:hypothetical protein